MEIEVLKRRHPEWAGWLAVVEQALAADGAPWDAAVPVDSPARAATPMLAEAFVPIRAGAVRELRERLIAAAERAGTPEMATLRRALAPDADLPPLFAASVCQRKKDMAAIAARSGADPDAFEAVAALLSVPFLHACRRRWAGAVQSAWTQPYCPICAAWPAFAEVRGIERSRFFRCGRCGSEWHAHLLRCVYCGTDEHEQLVTLRPEQPGAPGGAEACRNCYGYLKALTKLQPCPPGGVMIEDLATVNLDLAAVAAGYRRPHGLGAALHVTVQFTN